MLYMSSRRTFCDGEVVTFATKFKEHDGPFGGHDAAGPFEVSASREGVMVHRAFCRDAEQSELLVQAVGQAERVRENLADTWRGGAQSRYPAQPTLCMPPNNQAKPPEARKG